MSVLEQAGASGNTREIHWSSNGILRRAALLAGASVLVAVSAHVAVPLPFSPVPLTLQTFAVVLVGLLLGPTMAFGALTCYLIEGACGLPVFSPAGPGGLAQLLGPTGGYLFSYPAAAALAGYLYQSRQGSWLRGALAGTVATTLMLLAGSLWFAALLHTSSRLTLAGAVLPFLPGEALKIAAAAGIAAAITRARE